MSAVQIDAICRKREIVRRESTYSDFIEKASRLYAKYATHDIEMTRQKWSGWSLYAVSSRIRLFASDELILEAEKVVGRVIERYGGENISAEHLRTSAREKKEGSFQRFQPKVSAGVARSPTRNVVSFKLGRTVANA